MEVLIDYFHNASCTFLRTSVRLTSCKFSWLLARLIGAISVRRRNSSCSGARAGLSKENILLLFLVCSAGYNNGGWLRVLVWRRQRAGPCFEEHWGHPRPRGCRQRTSPTSPAVCKKRPKYCSMTVIMDINCVLGLGCS